MLHPRARLHLDAGVRSPPVGGGAPLGRRHAGYGVQDAHYDSVGAALLWTLEQGLGKSWNPDVAASWTEVYGVLSGIMRRAQREAASKAAA